MYPFIIQNPLTGKYQITQAPFIVLVGSNGGEEDKALKDIGFLIKRNEEHFENIVAFAAYGTSRLLTSFKGPIEDGMTLSGTLASLLDDDVEGRLFNVFSRELKNLSLNEPVLFDEVKQAILKLLPQVTDIVKEDESKVISDLAFIQYGQKVPFKKLSIGPKSLALMIGDMIFRLLAKQPKVKKVADLEGVVLINELELHLHPKWQQALPYLLHETFPKVQFIVTTNSAVCVASMPENSVFYKVRYDEKQGLEMQEVKLDTQTLLPNQVLTSELFEVDIFNNKDPRFIDTSNSAEERAKSKAQTDCLKGWFEKLEKKGK